MKENKNVIIYSLLSCFVLGFIVLIDYKSETDSLTESRDIHNSKNVKEPMKSIKSSESKVSRKIASIPSLKKEITPKAQQKDLKKDISSTHNKTKAVNIINQNWKELAYKKLSFTWGNKAGRQIDIEQIKPTVYVKHGIAKNVEHVKIKLTDEKGKRSNYEAYIDKETGSILHTWNRTRYEYKKKFYFNAAGKEFKSNPLNYENPNQ